MRFLADENFPLDSVRLLRAHGYDVFSVAEELSGSADIDVLQRAVSEGRVVLTFDKDFGELIFRQRLARPQGIVLFRDHPATPLEPAETILGILSEERMPLIGNFTVIERDKLRQRPLRTE
jgi:predicted nuclease of predicted toxin-antitoxin system